MTCQQIHILGAVGAGKSSLSKLLSVREDIILFPEPVKTNPYLEKFYEHPRSVAFQMQIFLLHARYKQAEQAQELDRCLMDMSMYGNDIFAGLMYRNGDISPQDYELYHDLSKSFKRLIPPPKLMVYLQVSPQVAVNRIMKRNRRSELKAPLEYWFDLNQAYEDWYETYDAGKKILINVDNVDFVSHEDEEDYILDIIMEEFNRD
jgi:deoxyadenosine/deoxycytidine kinase